MPQHQCSRPRARPSIQNPIFDQPPTATTRPEPRPDGIDADYYRLEVPEDGPAGPIDVWFDPQGRASVKLAIARPR